MNSRERGAAYNQHHGSKQHRDQSGRDEPTPQADDAIEISLAAIAAATGSVQEPPIPLLEQSHQSEIQEAPVPVHIDITV